MGVVVLGSLMGGGACADPEPEETPPPASMLRFVQAVDGAMQVSLSLYEKIPIHLEVLEGEAVSEVVISAGERSVAATDLDGDGVWTATWDLESAGVGVLPLTGSALIDGTSSEVHADLRIEQAGVQLTDYSVSGMVATPRALRRGEELWMTWADRAEGGAQAWLARIDGAARRIGEPTALVRSENKVLYARTAAGEESIGVLYQEPGAPIKNYFSVVSFKGEEVTPPVLLDPEGTDGLHGGDIAFDGEGFVMTWFSRRAGGVTELSWARLEEGRSQWEGPVLVARSGAGDADDLRGNFVPGTPVRIAAVEGRSAVSFVRYQYNPHPALAYVVAKAQVGWVDHGSDGVRTEFLGGEGSFFSDWESAVFSFGTSLLAVWASEDMNVAASTAPVWFYGKTSDATGEFGAGEARVLIEGSGARDSVAVSAGPGGTGGIGWLDQGAGEVDLYCSRISPALVVSADLLHIAHAVVSAGQAELGLKGAGTNSLVVWRDQRNHGQVSFETWFETLWN